MSSSYFQSLNAESQKRYLEKLMLSDQQLPDPLDDVIKNLIFKTDPALWPAITFPDIYFYLVEKECSYTKIAFRNFRSLDAYNYFLSGKVRNILTYKCGKLKICIITCIVQGSQNESKAHSPWVVVTCEGVIENGHCTCMAGLGESCSHVAALLFAIEAGIREGMNNPACTSIPCKWSRTIKKTEPKRASELCFSRKRKASEAVSYNLNSRLPSEAAHKELMNFIREHVPDAPILTVLTDSEDTDTASEPEEEINMPDIITMFKNLFEELPENVLHDKKIEIIIKKIKITESHLERIEHLTKSQRDNAIWEKQRRGRLTASMFGRVLRCKSGTEGIVRDILHQNKTFTSEATQWGIFNEANAINCFIDKIKDLHVNFQFNKAGLKIDDNYPYIGASADGLVSCDCCAPAVVEVKCPFKIRNEKIGHCRKELKFLDENLNLRLNHPYYDQIHGQMDVWKFHYCYFVVYTTIDTYIQKIEFDEDYWKLQKPILLSFYKNNVLPVLLKSH